MAVRQSDTRERERTQKERKRRTPVEDTDARGYTREGERKRGQIINGSVHASVLPAFLAFPH